MRAVVQRVTSGSVTVDGQLISSIGRGLLVLLGISRDDKQSDMDFMVRKILNTRLFHDDNDDSRWKRTVMEKKFEILCVSQFTLYGKLKGSKMDFHEAMAAEQSQPLYERFLEQLRAAYEPSKVQPGKFGAYMKVGVDIDGPVTLLLDSRRPEAASSEAATGADDAE